MWCSNGVDNIKRRPACLVECECEVLLSCDGSNMATQTRECDSSVTLVCRDEWSDRADPMGSTAPGLVGQEGVRKRRSRVDEDDNRRLEVRHRRQKRVAVGV